MYTKNMELLKLYSKEKTNFFCRIKLLYIKVRCLISVNVRLEAVFLKDKGGKQHCLIPFVGSNLGVETFLKKMEHQKRMSYNTGLRPLCILCIEVSRRLYVKTVCLLIGFWL